MTWILKIAKGFIVKALNNKQDEIVKFLNSKLDLPKLNEEEEAKLLNQIVDSLQLIVNKFL